MNAPGEAFWSQLPLGRGVRLLHRDANGLAAFDKPAGVLSHPNEPADEPRSLLTARYSLETECFEWTVGEGSAAVRSRLWLLNRLDSATSGVILAAASKELATEVRAHFKRRQIRKVYQALVFGVPSVPVQVWRDRLAVEKRAGQVRTSGAGHIPCDSQMQLLRRRASQPTISLLKLEPHTGRSHQLRVQCALRRLPIVGDATYGDFARNREFAKWAGTKRLFLHSLETAFDYDYAGKRTHFAAHAPLPEEFTAILTR